jgi:hypothetical protein
MLCVCLAGFPVHGAPAKPPQAVEKALRARVAEFYTLMVQRKYREAEGMVAPESRDTYYAGEKPAIEDFAIDAVSWQDGFKKANVSMVSTTKMRRPITGEYEVKVPYASHWVLEKGIWWWYVPVVSSRSTPFGPMKVDPNLASNSGIDLKAMIAKGPDAAAVAHAVHVDKTKVTLVENGSATVLIENTLAGPVKLVSQVLSGSGFDAVLQDSQLSASGKTQLTISRRPGSNFKPGHVSITVNPTSQIVDVQVN